MSGGPDLENLTRDYGREIFGRITSGGNFPFGPAWWDERLMEWTMGDEAVKVQLFRFIDALPVLHNPDAVNRHPRDYFAHAGDRLPAWMRFGLRWLPENGLFGRALAWSARTSARRLGH